MQTTCVGQEKLFLVRVFFIVDGLYPSLRTPILNTDEYPKFKFKNDRVIEATIGLPMSLDCSPTGLWIHLIIIDNHPPPIH